MHEAFEFIINYGGWVVGYLVFISCLENEANAFFKFPFRVKDSIEQNSNSIICRFNNLIIEKKIYGLYINRIIILLIIKNLCKWKKIDKK